MEVGAPDPADQAPAMHTREHIKSVRVKAPTRGNRKLEKFLEAVNRDDEVRTWWYMAQVHAERLGMSDHSWVHMQIVLNIGLRLTRLLEQGAPEGEGDEGPGHGRPASLGGAAVVVTFSAGSAGSLPRPIRR